MLTCGRYGRTTDSDLPVDWVALDGYVRCPERSIKRVITTIVFSHTGCGCEGGNRECYRKPDGGSSRPATLRAMKRAE